MFQMTTVEIISSICALFTCVITMIMAQHIFTSIDNGFIKIKNEKKQFENKIQELERENDKFKNTGLNFSNIEKKLHHKNLTEEEIEIIISENRKLHIRCDMLEEELKRERKNLNSFYYVNK